jgi:hypothetical protein
MEEATLYVKVRKDQKDWLEEQAKKEDRPVSWIVRKLLDEAKSKEEEK